MANVFLPNGASPGAYLRGNKLPGLINATTKVDLEIDNLIWIERVTVQALIDLGARFYLYHDGTNDNVILMTGGATKVLGPFESVFGEDAFSTASDLKFVLESDGGITASVDGTPTYTGNMTRGTNMGVDDFLRLGANGIGDITADARYFMREGSQIGDTRLRLDDVMVREIVMPSDPSTTSFTESGESTVISVQNGDGTDFAALGPATTTKRATFDIPTDIQNLSTISTAVCTVDGTTGIDFSSPVSVAQIDFSGATYEVNLDAVDTITNGQELVMLASDYLGGTASSELIMISTATAVVTTV